MILITDFSGVILVLQIYTKHFLNNNFFYVVAYQRIEKYMHVGRGQETAVMGNPHGQSKFPKK